MDCCPLIAEQSADVVAVIGQKKCLHGHMSGRHFFICKDIAKYCGFCFWHLQQDLNLYLKFQRLLF